MADFLFSTRIRAPGELIAELRAWLEPVTVRTFERHGDWGSLAWVEGAHDADVVRDDGGRLTVLIGDPLACAAGARVAVHAPGVRARLHESVGADRGLRDWRLQLDGHFALLEVRADGGRIVTDPFAFVPVFRARDASGALVAGTHVDAVAAAADCSLDPVSLADVVANLTCTFPWTVYAGVEQCEPGAELRFGRAGEAVASQVYWEPRETAAFRRIEDAASALRDAVRADVESACASGACALLLSGGEDSRVVLGAVPAGADVLPVTYAERETREVRTARRVARACGRRLAVGWRSGAHYSENFDAVAALLGSHHLVIDVHGHGLHRALGLESMHYVLGGLSSDSLLKGTYAHGPALHTARPQGIPPALLDEVEQRRTRHHARLEGLRPRSAAEWMSLWPMSMRKHGGNVDGNRRLFRSHEVFHSTRVLEIAAAVPSEWKQHRKLFHRAMRPLLRSTWYVPHARYGLPWLGRTGNIFATPAVCALRTVRALLTSSIGKRQSPWPKWRAVADHARIAREVERVSSGESALHEILGGRELADAVAHWRPLRRIVLAQLAFTTRHTPVIASSDRREVR